MIMRLALSSCLSVFLGVGAVNAASIQGDYIEARTADVFTGPCFSNSEVFLSGNHAVVAWKVRTGSWAGQDLSGLVVAAAVRANTTFSEDSPERAEAVVIVDDRATKAQSEALVDLAKHLAGERLRNVRAVRAARMSLTVEDHAVAQAAHQSAMKHTMPQAAKGSFWAAGLAEIVTRPLDDRDHVCGNEDVAYAPLSTGVTAKPAYTLGHRFQGEGLNATWSDPNCRSSFVGQFAY